LKFSIHLLYESLSFLLSVFVTLSFSLYFPFCLSLYPLLSFFINRLSVSVCINSYLCPDQPSVYLYLPLYVSLTLSLSLSSRYIFHFRSLFLSCPSLCLNHPRLSVSTVAHLSLFARFQSLYPFSVSLYDLFRFYLLSLSLFFCLHHPLSLCIDSLSLSIYIYIFIYIYQSLSFCLCL
jgi:hypothetical protein